MSKPRLLSHDPLTGVREYFQYDNDAKEFTIHTEQEIDPVLQDNSMYMADVNERTPWKYNGSYDAPVRVAQIPIQVWRENRKNGLTPKHDKKYRNWLNSAENKGFRTRPGRV